MLSLWHVSRVLEGGINRQNRSRIGCPLPVSIAVWCRSRAPLRLAPWHPHHSVPSSTRMSLGRRALRRWGPGLAGTALAWLCPSSSGSSQSTPPCSQPSSASVTITHPPHPLSGQRVDMVRIRRGPDPDLLIRLRDGTHPAIAMRGTDSAASPEPPPSAGVIPVRDLEGLRPRVAFLEHLRGPQRPPSQESTV
jgi:hypothetical protein